LGEVEPDRRDPTFTAVGRGQRVFLQVECRDPAVAREPAVACDPAGACEQETDTFASDAARRSSHNHVACHPACPWFVDAMPRDAVTPTYWRHNSSSAE